MKVVNGFRDFFNAVLSDEDEEDEEQPDVAPLPLQQQHRFGERLDISVSINNTNNSSGGEESSGESLLGRRPFSDDGDFSSGSSTGGDYEPPQPLNNAYYARLGRPFFQQQPEAVERALRVYQAFREWAPLAQVQERPYNEVDLAGLEHLMEATQRLRHATLPFARLYHNEATPAVAFPLHAECTDTFVVSRAADYLYGRLIEDALLARAHQVRLPPGFRDTRASYWSVRDVLYPLCREPRCQASGDRDARACHLQWVVYTRLDSPFYVFCERHRDSNRYCDYERHDGCLGVRMPVSFHVVNFLCGPLPGDPALTELYDQWVVVRLDFLDLWNTRGQIELKQAEPYY